MGTTDENIILMELLVLTEYASLPSPNPQKSRIFVSFGPTIHPQDYIFSFPQYP